MLTSRIVVKRNPVLARLGLPEFRPFPPFIGGRAQTIAASFWPQLPDIRPTRTEIIDLPDGDQLVCLENRPAGWQPRDRILVLVHGLAGSDQSKYMIRMTRKLVSHGYLTVRVNLRGCGKGVGRARKPYHSGRSEDIRAVLSRYRDLYPNAPVTLSGFSLGANIVLKLAGEDGANPTGNLDSVTAVSPPAHLAASAKKLCHPNTRVFSNFFMEKVIEHVEQVKKAYPDVPEFKPWKGMTVSDFDDSYTAPHSGFLNAADYYAKAAALPVIASIQIPTLILTSADDPVVDTDSVRELPPIPGVDVIVTNHGGHVAFIGQPLSKAGVRWMDTVILRWIDRMATCGCPEP
ncbi:MAG: alpha/beta fold hydrolase [Oligoflexia bacterium]|nr:alpha/beta fold hydrolase [Oligoflexia bacterium]